MSLTLAQRAEWLWDTVHQLAMLPGMTDEDMLGLIFEDLSSDVWTALHPVNVAVLQREGYLSSVAAGHLVGIHRAFKELEQSAHNRKDYSGARIRSDPAWTALFAKSERLLSEREDAE